jgi:LPS sulfotransferase NodH
MAGEIDWDPSARPPGLRRWSRRGRAFVKKLGGSRKSLILQLSYARSGSTLLDRYISSSPNVGSIGEVLHYTNATGRTPGEWWPLSWHLQLMPHLVNEENVLVKIHLTHLERHSASVRDVIGALRPHCVILHYRDDSVAQFVSQILASKTRAFRATDKSVATNDAMVTFDAVKYKSYICVMDRLYREALRDLGQHSHVVIRHEDVVDDPVRVIEGALSASISGLHISSAAPLARQADRAVVDYLVNPGALDSVCAERRMSCRIPDLVQSSSR